MALAPILLVVTLAVAGCGRDTANAQTGADASKGAQKGASGGAPAAPPALPVTVITAAKKSVPIVLEVPGQAVGSRDVEIRARVTGIVEKRVYDEGQAVKANAVLFRIDPKPYEIALAQAKAALGEARAKAEFAAREAKRLEGLAKERAISQRDYDTAVSNASQTAASVKVAEAQVDAAQLNLSYCVVNAPISGVTGRAQRSEGSLVTAGTDSALLTTLTQVNPIWILFSLASGDYDRVRNARERAKVELLDSDGKPLPVQGKLNFTGSTVDPKLSTVQLRAEFANPKLEFLPGQFVRVRLLAGEQQGVLVPQAALVQTEQSRMVWVVGDDGKAAMKPVQTAGWLGNDWIVTEGLAPGDRVIVDNLIKLRPGAPVQPRAAQ